MKSLPTTTVPTMDGDADGYTNLTFDEFSNARDEVYKKSTTEQRNLQKDAQEAGLAEIYMGTMEQYVTLLKKLAGSKDLKLMTMPSSTDIASDWMSQFVYSIDNLKYYGTGSSETFEFLDGALATPEYVTHRDFSVLEMEMQNLSDDEAVSTAKDDHAAAKSNQIIGVVTHIEDYEGNPTFVQSWMKYLKSKDPKGSRNKTVSKILGSLN